MRGLLEVEQLHFTCAATSEATRIDNMDTVSANASTSNVNMDDLLIAPMVAEAADQIYSKSDKVCTFDYKYNYFNLNVEF